MRIRWGRAPWLVAACGVVLAGCASFDDRASGQTFEPAPDLTAPAAPQPELPELDGNSGGDGTTRPSAPQTSVPPPQGCTDFDKAVIATCLDTVAAVAALPGSDAAPAALAGERKSGRVLQVTGGAAATELIKLSVDASGDGGLTGLALSPSYAEDQLVFAYITTPTDNRVVRFTKGQQAKPILTGIPKGPTDNRGAITAFGNGTLLVATGDAGNPAAAADPNSLAGKVLRIDTAGNAATGNPTAGSRVFASGLHSPGGLCKSADAGRVWVTDEGATADALYRVNAGTSLAAPAWSWPDRPGLAGCADTGESLMIATSVAGNMQQVPITLDGSVGGQPKAMMDGKNGTGYGRYGGMDPVNTQYAVVGTVNKDGGTPVSSDDRVVIIQLQPNSGGGNGKD
ncbi:PQQ-dependent sugar dehydrogenase [Amycolatopsis acidiphila]|uniref:Glucose dehydrogenase n=1 Tax=Amycolatopsis acidiphila TaxID=715473 RepID=A0A558A8J0_9PSEU|nr:PQQ-dependent sugar dehydrogenase [Amycolatopsis acidiphila]TVT20580.1 glucose dehydrogenase [Amycolatopsis acidiphila]UIJ61426.1 PQQ-dependent sugar dehydrogenase [Amycolatopsis acidiphila]GHG77759.1 glucose dehydrogenase [Amycolatopsis acidiphila]